MQSGISLDSRLMMCADFVRENARVADIGTDHAYLPLWLCLNGKCPSAVAADINPEPLSRGIEKIKSLNAQHLVSARLSDGLENIKSDEADDIVIAGMGGELIAKIIDGCSFSKDSGKHFILQPMTKSEALIKYLCDNGFEILRQDCCIACKKCYTVILASYTGKNREYDEVFYYLGRLDPKNNGTHRLFAENQILRLTKQAKGDMRFLALAERIREKMQ